MPLCHDLILPHNGFLRSKRSVCDGSEDFDARRRGAISRKGMLSLRGAGPEQRVPGTARYSAGIYNANDAVTCAVYSDIAHLG